MATRPTGKTRDDLARFGRLVARQPILRLIELRNTGMLSESDFNRLEILLDGALLPSVEVLLDGFETQVDVARALNELEPMPQAMMKRLIKNETDMQLRGWRARIETAIRYLKADPR